MAKEKEVKFEDKMVELETIINELENGEVDLDSSIEKYTRAMKLVNECDEKLKSIEEQVNKIVKEDGSLEDFETEAIEDQSLSLLSYYKYVIIHFVLRRIRV